MPKKYSTEQIAKTISEKTNGQFQLIGEHVNSHAPVKIKHQKCGQTQSIKLHYFMNRMTCRICSSNRRTNEDFLSEVCFLVGDEYRFQESYINDKTKIKVLHKTCNQIYSVSPANFIRLGRRCKCNKNSQLVTEELKATIYGLVGEEFSVNEECANASNKINLTHRKCGNQVSLSFASFKANQRCPYCSRKTRISTINEFRDHVYKESSGEYTVSGEYINARTHLTFTHNVCDKSYESTPDNFNSGKRCPHCFGHFKRDTQWFKSKVYDIVKNEYRVIGEYEDYFKKIEIYHTHCKTVYQATPATFLGSKNRQGRRCPTCFKNEKKTTRQFIQELYTVVGDEYEVVGEYAGANKKISILHKVCGDVFTPSPSNILSGKSGCTCESENRGESKVKELLDLQSVNFHRQYSHPDCKYRMPLRFDFAIYNDHNQLQCLIEYDGKQHHEPIEYFGGKKAFKLQQKKDKIKDDYCNSNNIPLIRIPYWDFKNIDSILTERLTELGVLSPALVEV